MEGAALSRQGMGTRGGGVIHYCLDGVEGKKGCFGAWLHVSGIERVAGRGEGGGV